MTGSAEIVHCGVDIGKEQLVCFISQGSLSKSFDNNAKSIVALIAWARSHKVTHLVFEPTGGYEYLLQMACWEHGMTMLRINPTWMRRYAQALGHLEKTDAIDARLICKYAQAQHAELLALPQPTTAQLQLGQLVLRRQQIVEDMSAEKCRLQQAHLPLVIKDIQSSIRQMQKRLNKMEEQIRQTIPADTDLQKRAKVLREIKGVGEVLTMVLLAQMPELGTLNRREAAKLAGVAPISHDSGKMTGRRYTQGGRANLRKVLYMATQTAIRWNEAIRKHHERFMARNMAKKIAKVACMRHFIILINNALKPQKGPPTEKLPAPA